MDAKSEFRTIESGNAKITGFSYSIPVSSVVTSSIISSSQSGAYLLVTNLNASAISDIRVGITEGGAFMKGAALSYSNFYHKISPLTAWTVFTAYSTTNTSGATVSIYQSSSPLTSKTFNIGIQPGTGHDGYLDGKTFYKIWIVGT